MKKFILLMTGLLLLPIIATAYQVNIDAPETLAVGKPLVVTGVTTFPPGMAVDVVLYYQLTTTTEIKRQVVAVRPDKTFKVVFDTTGLKPGTYKVEVPVNGMGDSITMRLVRIVDRSDDIQITSPAEQPFSGTLTLAGTIRGDENAGVQVEVIGPDNSLVFGPQFINTDYEGSFATEIPIRAPGEYEVSFTDAKGFIGTRIVTATGPQGIVPALNPGSAVAGVVASARAPASQDLPAYFIVQVRSEPVTLFTSASVDWILEYTDENGVVRVENRNDSRSPERISVMGAGPVFVRISPAEASVLEDVTLYAENASSVMVSPVVPAPFAAPPGSGTPSVPLTPLAAVAALVILILLRR